MVDWFLIQSGWGVARHTRFIRSPRAVWTEGVFHFSTDPNLSPSPVIFFFQLPLWCLLFPDASLVSYPSIDILRILPNYSIWTTQLPRTWFQISYGESYKKWILILLMH